MLDDLLNMYKSDKVMEKSLKNPFKVFAIIIEHKLQYRITTEDRK